MIIEPDCKKGVDIIGFQFASEGSVSPNDKLIMFESKARLSSGNAENILETAVIHSAKDIVRKAESLNAIKQRYVDKADLASAEKIARFQDLADNPYIEAHGAAAIVLTERYDSTLYQQTGISNRKSRKVWDAYRREYYFF